MPRLYSNSSSGKVSGLSPTEVFVQVRIGKVAVDPMLPHSNYRMPVTVDACFQRQAIALPMLHAWDGSSNINTHRSLTHLRQASSRRQRHSCRYLCSACGARRSPCIPRALPRFCVHGCCTHSRGTRTLFCGGRSGSTLDTHVAAAMMRNAQAHWSAGADDVAPPAQRQGQGLEYVLKLFCV
jgi:hypothetical protein